MVDPEANAVETARLVERIRAGEPAAETELMERFRRGLVLVLRRRSGDPELAEDLAQETLAVVLERARQGSIEHPDRLAGFVHGTARNLLLAHRRKTGRYVALDEERDADRGPAEVGRTPPVQLDGVVRREEAREVRRLLAELPVPRDREVLVRFYLGSEPRDAICASLGIDPEHFRRVLFRARERLRDLWTRNATSAGWDGGARPDTHPRGAE